MKRTITTLNHPDLAGLSPLELQRKMTLLEVAEFTGLSVDTIKRNYSHLLVRIGKRRWAMSVRNAIALPPAST